jgi:Tol biopolymer transport system component
VNTENELEKLADVSIELSHGTTDVKICAKGTHLLVGEYDSGMCGWTYWVINALTGQSTILDPGKDSLFCRVEWWPMSCDTVLAAIQPWLETGRFCKAVPALVDIETGAISLLGDTPTAYTIVFAASPNGKALAFTQEEQPWIYRPEIGSFPLDLDSFDFSFLDAGFIRPAWSPDSRQVAWLVWGDVDEEWIEGVAVLNFDENTSEFFYPHSVWSGEMLSYFSWSPAGDSLLVDSGWEGISVINLDGTVRYKILNAGNRSWSPDGQWLAYNSFENGERNVEVRSADGDEQVELGPGVPVIWSPDGQIFLFDHETGGMMMVKVGVWNAVKLDLPDDVRVIDWHLFTQGK